VIKPAYSVSFLLSINVFLWQNVLYFPIDVRTFSIFQDKTTMAFPVIIYAGGENSL